MVRCWEVSGDGNGSGDVVDGCEDCGENSTAYAYSCIMFATQVTHTTGLGLNVLNNM